MKTLKDIGPNDILYEICTRSGIEEAIVKNVRDEGVFTRFYTEYDTHIVPTKMLPNTTWFGNFYCNKGEAVSKLIEECNKSIENLKKQIDFLEKLKENERHCWE